MAKKSQDVCKDINLFETGKKIFDFRRKKGYSQAKIAEMLDVSPKTVSNWERGTRLISLEHLVRLSIVLNTTTNDLLSLAAEEVVSFISNIYFGTYLIQFTSRVYKSIWVFISVSISFIIEIA